MSEDEESKSVSQNSSNNNQINNNSNNNMINSNNMANSNNNINNFDNQSNSNFINPNSNNLIQPSFNNINNNSNSNNLIQPSFNNINNNPSNINNSNFNQSHFNMNNSPYNLPPQIINQESRKTIEIIVESAEFSKPFNYFIVVQLDGNEEKRRTRVSAPTNKPKFDDNKFYLPLLPYDLIIHQSVIFSAFIVVDSSDNINQDGTGQAKLLGENIVELAPLTGDLTNIANSPIKQRVDLYRKMGDKNAIVGKLNIQLKLLNEIIVPEDIKEKTNNDMTQLLPEMGFTKKFVWRLRIDVRSAVNLPFNKTTEIKMPSAYVEVGWSMYENTDINQVEAVRTPCIENNRFPIWNQELLFYPPSSLTKIDGFITILLKDRYQMNPIQKCIFPLSCLRPFHPAHLDLMLDTIEQEPEKRSHLYISLTLEDSPIYKLSESYINILINMINLEPLPKSTNRCCVLMTTDKYKPNDNVYLQVELKSRTHLSNVLNYHKNQPYSLFMSNTMNIPPIKLKNSYNAIASFIITRTLIDKDLTFFLMVRDGKIISNHNMPNVIAGEIETSIEMMKTSFFSKKHEIIPFKITWFNQTEIYSSLAHSRGIVEFSLRPVEELPEVAQENNMNKDIDDIDYDKVKENIIKKAMNDFTVNMANIPEKEKWDVLSKELTQKQELIHRMMKEVDDKTESLKLTGSEIIELRKQIKLLQNENQILRRRLGQEEQMQIEALVTQEIHKMSLPELKSKIIKLAQAYRGERMRNEEFEKALKQAQNEIANARKLSNELENLQKVHENDTNKYLNLQKETQKIGLYRETIKKQEEVIVKMENLLKKTMNDNERQKDSLMELEQLRTENLKLQKELKDFVVNATPGVIGRNNIELEKSKNEIKRLQQLINELQDDLRNKRPISAEKKELQTEILQLEVKYQKSQARVMSLEKELENSAKNNAKEIAALKLMLAEKQALIENMRMENAV